MSSDSATNVDEFIDAFWCAFIFQCHRQCLVLGNFHFDKMLIWMVIMAAMVVTIITVIITIVLTIFIFYDYLVLTLFNIYRYCSLAGSYFLSGDFIFRIGFVTIL